MSHLFAGLREAGARPVRLRALNGPCEGQAVQVPGPKFFIGRDPGCQLRPDIPGLSAIHALIEQSDGQVFLRDLDSDAGTVVNGVTLHSRSAQVFEGDEVAIGPLHLALEVGEPGSRETVLAKAPPGWPFTDRIAWMVDQTGHRSP